MYLLGWQRILPSLVQSLCKTHGNCHDFSPSVLVSALIVEILLASFPFRLRWILHNAWSWWQKEIQYRRDIYLPLWRLQSTVSLWWFGHCHPRFSSRRTFHLRIFGFARGIIWHSSFWEQWIRSEHLSSQLHGLFSFCVWISSNFWPVFTGFRDSIQLHNLRFARQRVSDSLWYY